MEEQAGLSFFVCVWNDNDFDPGFGLAFSSLWTVTTKLQTAWPSPSHAFIYPPPPPPFSDGLKDLSLTHKLRIYPQVSQTPCWHTVKCTTVHTNGQSGHFKLNRLVVKCRALRSSICVVQSWVHCAQTSDTLKELWKVAHIHTHTDRCTIT